MSSERLQKIIAAAGITSRRKAEQLIAGGLVSVNGQVVTELGSKADPEHDHIRVNGKLLHGAQKNVYLLMNKPKGYITAVTDPEKRPTVMDLLRGVGVRVYPVGRLDYASEGLLLLSNDGELAAALMKASSHVPKTYLVKSRARRLKTDWRNCVPECTSNRRVGDDPRRRQPKLCRYVRRTIPGMKLH